MAHQPAVALDAGATRRIFQSEYNRALDALEDEREHATLPGYEFGNATTFLDVQEEVSRYLVETNCSGDEPDFESWAAIGQLPLRPINGSYQYIWASR